MAKLFDTIDESLRAFIESAPMFFVATAPSGDGGHVNLSPKGGAGLFRVTGPLGFAYVDLMGSGIETIAHLRENGRIVVMFCAFEGAPKIVRLHGVGRPVQQRDEGFEDLLATFDVSDDQRRAVRSVITVEVAARGRLVRLRRAADGLRRRARPALPVRRQPHPQARRGGGQGVREREQRGEPGRADGPRPARLHQRSPQPVRGRAQALTNVNCAG